jgi:methylphosphotriester-DNA--protein-cysteine methyltransferase
MAVKFVTDQELVIAGKLKADGFTWPEIADRLGYKPRSLARYYRIYGQTGFTSRFGASAERRRQALELLEAGASMDDMMVFWGVTRPTARQYALNLGYTITDMDEVRRDLGLPPADKRLRRLAA